MILIIGHSSFHRQAVEKRHFMIRLHGSRSRRSRCRDRFEFAARKSEEMEPEEEMSLQNENMVLRKKKK
jgi:hypothetical protein